MWWEFPPVGHAPLCEVACSVLRACQCRCHDNAAPSPLPSRAQRLACASLPPLFYYPNMTGAQHTPLMF